MRAVAIDPAKKCISLEDVDPRPGELRRLCGATPNIVATLPNGDVVLAADGEQAHPGFSLGGTKPIRAPAVVLGKLDPLRQRTAARSSIELLNGLTRWIDGDEQEQPATATIQVILVDPEAGKIDHVEIAGTIAGIEGLLGGGAAPLMKVPGDDVVYGKNHSPGWRWRKDDCVFNGRCVIAGSDSTSFLLEPVASVEILRRTVEFGPPGKTAWVTYGEHAARLDNESAR
jgi:hypothetical protein